MIFAVVIISSTTLFDEYTTNFDSASSNKQGSQTVNIGALIKIEHSSAQKDISLIGRGLVSEIPARSMIRRNS